VVIGIETDRSLFVTALAAAGYQLCAVSPMSASRYRDRHSTSGAKSDAGDAQVLAEELSSVPEHHPDAEVVRSTDDGRAATSHGPSERR
jgi:hypothetical protein